MIRGGKRMRYIKIFFQMAFLLICAHAPLFITQCKIWQIIVILACLLIYIMLEIISITRKKHKRIQLLMKGRKMIGYGLWGYLLSLLMIWNVSVDTIWYVTDIIWMVCSLYVYILCGAGIIFILSKRLRIVKRGLIYLVLFIPIVHLPVLCYLRYKAKEEWDHELYMVDIRALRANKQICATKYPILMLHGVGFRDFKYVNYWGRIPKVLSENGAVIYFGNQEAFATIEHNGKQIMHRILEICEQQHCDKVNIIAHSKGGLDARYVISACDMGKHVASLTTISTPHKGCRFVDVLIFIVPDRIYRYLAHIFDGFFHRIGDKHPDFYTATHQFSTTWAKRFNEEIKDDENVYYQSYMSLMHGAFSHKLLTIPYLFIKLVDGKSDGLVSEESAKWGNFRKTFENEHYRGISHGDIIDLTREDYKGFQVCETYVDIVKELKDKGF